MIDRILESSIHHLIGSQCIPLASSFLGAGAVRILDCALDSIPLLQVRPIEGDADYSWSQTFCSALLCLEINRQSEGVYNVVQVAVTCVIIISYNTKQYLSNRI